MFVQVIQGKVSDAKRMRAAFDHWVRDVAPGAIGWLGSTSGITADGRFIALARFESEPAARRNSARPEQDRWWSQTAKLFTGKVIFHDSSDVTMDLPGDPDRAHFVQIMQGHGKDPERARELMARDADKWAAFRPEILGSLMIVHDAGMFTGATYFTSESAARAGERKQPPPELAEQMQELNDLTIGEPEFFDLNQPWLHSR